MLRMIVFFALITMLTGSRRERRSILTGLLTFMAVMYGMRILFYMVCAGFSLLPFIIVIALLGHVVVPFIKGFMSRIR